MHLTYLFEVLHPVCPMGIRPLRTSKVRVHLGIGIGRTRPRVREEDLLLLPLALSEYCEIGLMSRSFQPVARGPVGYPFRVVCEGLDLREGEGRERRGRKRAGHRDEGEG